MPNAQGGYTAEEEAEAVQRAIAAANWQPPPEQTPTIEEQLAQGPEAIAQGLLGQNAEYQNQQNEQRGILDVLGTTQGYGLGPPYEAAAQPYNGPPPMEAQPDWNYDSGYPGNWHDFDSNIASTGGGFFNMEELFHSRGIELPWAFQRGAQMPSTNNYRLLPPEYRHPNFIMRNGQIINMNSPTVYGPFGEKPLNEELSGSSWRSGAAVGYPAAFSLGPVSYAYAAWPGQLGPYSWHGSSMMGGS